MNFSLTWLTETTPVIRITANIDRINSRPTLGHPAQLGGMPQISPPVQLATEHVRLAFAIARQQHAIGGALPASGDGGHQHLELIDVERLEQLLVDALITAAASCTTTTKSIMMVVVVVLQQLLLLVVFNRTPSFMTLFLARRLQLSNQFAPSAPKHEH